MIIKNLFKIKNFPPEADSMPEAGAAPLVEKLKILAKGGQGFTLIEIVTVTAIILILSGIVFFNFRTGDVNLAMQRSAQLATQAVATTLNHTLSGQNHQGTVSGGGYGIYFEEGSNMIIVFADCDKDGAYDSTGAAASCAAANSTTPFPENFSEVELEKQITIGTLSPCTGTPCALTITFAPPVPRAQFSPVLGVLNEATITLQHQNGKTIDVTINELGVTSIQ